MTEPQSEHDDGDALPERNRAEVLRDVVVFQLKLVVDGFRDLVLIPSSAIIGLYSIIVSPRPGEPFYRLLRAGHATESWIDLFGDAYPDDDDDDASTTDRYASRWGEVEQKLRELERSLPQDDYRGAARKGFRELREQLKRHL